MAKDPALAPLRDRDDFQQLVAELFDRIFPDGPVRPRPLTGDKPGVVRDAAAAGVDHDQGFPLGKQSRLVRKEEEIGVEEDQS